MKKFIFIIIQVVFCTSVVTSQEGDPLSIIQATINDVFSEIQPSKITTGVLIERSIPELAIFEYNGSDTSMSCSATDWLKIYKQLYFAHLNSEEFDYDTSLFTTYPSSVSSDEDIDVGIILYDYNRIGYNAINEGKIVFDSTNYKILDVTGPNENPFEITSCFAAVPLVTELDAGTYNFLINPDLFISNKSNLPDELYIDFDDGNGLISTSIGSSSQVTYSSIGVKNIKIKAVIDNFEYHSNSFLEVVGDFEKSLVNFVFADYGPENFRSLGINAEYGIYYRCNGDGTIRKPYLIVSGFDPEDKNRVEDIVHYNQFIHRNILNTNYINLYRVANKDGYLDRLREDGYDIIIYRSKESTHSIIFNGLNLANFIQKINDEKTSDNELIVAGASMGGLVVRFALTYMENNGIDHQTKLFISVDSPQNGANVPLGLQYMVYYINRDLNGVVSWLHKLEDAKAKILDSDAAQQMLLYHYLGTFGNQAKCSDKRTSFLNTLDNIGNFPKNCRNIALSMGSGTGESQGFAPGELLFKKYPGSIAADLLTAGSNIRWEFEFSAVPNHSSGEIYFERISLQPCIYILVRCTYFPFLRWESYCLPPAPINPINPERSISVNNTDPIDNAPGSIQNFHNTRAFTGGEEIMGYDILDFISLLGTNLYTEPNSDCFIPSYSALGLNSVSPHTNIKSYLGNHPDVLTVDNNQYINVGGEDVSYFDVMYIENENDYHIYDNNKEGVFSEEMLDFMKDETSPNDLYLEDMTFTSGEKAAYEARNSIAAGNDVDGIPDNNGDVIIENGGKLSLVANESVKLEKGFHARPGSEIHVSHNAPFYCSEGQIVTPGAITFKSSSLDMYYDDKTYEATEDTDLKNMIDEYSKPVLFYPNPIVNTLYISSNKEANNLQLYSINGYLIYDLNFSRKHEVDFSDLPSGIYIIKVTQKNGETIIQQVNKL